MINNEELEDQILWKKVFQWPTWSSWFSSTMKNWKIKSCGRKSLSNLPAWSTMKNWKIKSCGRKSLSDLPDHHGSAQPWRIGRSNSVEESLSVTSLRDQRWRIGSSNPVEERLSVTSLHDQWWKIVRSNPVEESLSVTFLIIMVQLNLGELEDQIL